MRYPWHAEQEYFEGRDSGSSEESLDDLYPQPLFRKFAKVFDFQNSRIVIPLGESPDKKFSHQGQEVTLAGAHKSVDDPRKIVNQVPPHKSILNRRYFDKRRRQNRDLVILITSRNAERGIGKTTLAVVLAKWLNPDWSAEELGCVTPEEFLSLYQTASESSIIVWDESERLSSRRAQKDENLEISEAVAALRYRELFTFATLPSSQLIDKNMRRFASLKIHCISRGHAKVQVLGTDDSPPHKEFVRNLETIRWNSLGDDPELELLAQMKQESFDFQEGEEESPTIQDIEEARENELKKIVRRLYDSTDMSQKEIADTLDNEERSLSQSKVSRIVNS
jgi:hypothetical protein